MKVAVVYDSVFGNTKMVADAIAEQLKTEGHEAELHNLREDAAKGLQADYMFLGGPTRMKHMTRKVKGFIKGLDKNYWNTHTIVAFDTYGPIGKTEEERKKQEKWINPGAAGEIQELSRERGLKVYPSSLRLTVTGLKGPLDPEGPQIAKRFVHEVALSISK